MGLRFRKGFNVIPGVRLNVSKSGATLSVGKRGMTVNLGRRGVRGTAGLPGTGLSYSGYSSNDVRNAGATAKLRQWLITACIIAAIAWVVYKAVIGQPH